jgi:chemotaxis protein MotB
MNLRLSTSPVSRDRWLISYADFMTLLCAFFTALYATTRAGAPAAATPPVPLPLPTPVAAPAAEPPAAAQAVALRLRLEQDLAPELAAGYLQLVEDPRGLVIEIPEAGAFEVGLADLSAEATAMLQRIAGVVVTLPNGLRVEGHTDDRPIRTARYGSNWELSTARATRVVEFLITTGGVAPARLSAAGYSEFHPRGDNATPAGRTRNRRVDIVLLNEATRQAEEPGGSGRS